jgi:hypothetical protein
MKTTIRFALLTLSLIVAFSAAALAGPDRDRQGPVWEPCDYGDTYSCG